MTGNQIAYAKYLEDARHNQETEAQGWSSIAETTRHNKETENINWFTAKDTAAYHQGQLKLGRDQLAETNRHNLATENLQGQQIALGFANLSETSRHNQEVEKDTDYKQSSDREIGLKNYLENQRHNMANEWYDEARLQETIRRNNWSIAAEATNAITGGAKNIFSILGFGG